MICTNYRKPPSNSYVAQAFTVHYPDELKNLLDFLDWNNLRKMLVNIFVDSLRRIPIRCGIDAKVRRKNEIARVLTNFF